MFPVLLAASLWHYVFGIVIFSTSLFLILLVLVQRGRGGGLTGALGGMGGQSAFGAKAGDTFTRVTMVTATIWILTCMLAIKVLGTQDNWGAAANERTEITAPQSSSDQGEGPASSGEGAGGGAAEEGAGSGAAKEGTSSGTGGGIGTPKSSTPSSKEPAAP